MKIKLVFALLLISLLITVVPAEAHRRDKMPEPPMPNPADIILENINLPKQYRPPASSPYRKAWHSTSCIRQNVPVVRSCWLIHTTRPNDAADVVLWLRGLFPFVCIIALP